MALTYLQLKQLIQDYLQQSDATLVGDIPFIVRAGEDLIHKAIVLPNFKKTQDGTLTMGGRFLAAPSDFVAPLALVVTVSGNYTPLIPKEVSAIYEMYPVTASTAPPKYYAMWNDSVFLLGPTPDQAYAAEFQYFYKPTSLADTADPGTTWLSQNAEHTLFAACMVEALRFQKAEDDIYTWWQQELTRTLQDLRKVVEGMDETDAWRRNEIKTPVPTTWRAGL